MNPGPRRFRVSPRRAAGGLLAFGGVWLALPVLGGVRLESSIEPREATVGDVLRLEVTAVLDAGSTLAPFTPPEDWGAFELVGVSSTPAAEKDGRRVQRFTVSLRTFEVGVATVPAFAFAEEGGKTDIKTPEIPVTIRSVLTPESRDIRGLKGALGEILNKALLWAAAGLAAAAGLGFWLWRRRRKKRGVPGPPPRPAHETALESLTRLEGDLAGPAKAFYIRLTEILRRYLEGRFSVDALDRTTAEIASALRDLPFSPDQRLALRDALETGDLAKFARFEPAPEDRARDLSRVRDFVLATRPEEPTPSMTKGFSPGPRPGASKGPL